MKEDTFSPNRFFLFSRNISVIYKITIIAVILLLQASVTILLYFTGGIQSSYTYMMVLPILAATIFFGSKGGLIFGLVGGMMMGPLLSLIAQSDIMPQQSGWLLRTVFYMTSGYVVGIFFEKLNDYHIQLFNKDNYLGNTDIMSATTLYNSAAKICVKDSGRSMVLIYIHINNRDKLTDIIKLDNFQRLLVEIRDRLDAELSHHSGIYARDFDGLFTVFDKRNLDDNLNVIKQVMDQTFTVEKIPLYIESSIAAVLLEDDINRALNRSLIEARNAYKNQQHVHVALNNYSSSKREMTLLGSVRNSIINNDFYLVYQPKVDLRSGNIVGAEALIRWHHPEVGMVSPNEFIPLTERTALINPLTDWVVDTVLSTLSNNKQHYDAETQPIAINLSTANLFQPDFISKLKEKLDSYNLSCKTISFEITETLFMKDPEKSMKVFQDLKSMGIKVSIDDFGTGHSSLSYLSTLPVDEIKLDQSFTKRLFNSELDSALIEGIIGILKNTKKISLAEGVETEEECRFLKTYHTDMAQGYYFAKPMRFEELLDFISNSDFSLCCGSSESDEQNVTA